MNCEACGKREATVRYAEVVDGALSTWHLCEECARERGVGDSLSSLAGPLVNILMGLLEGPGPSVPDGGEPSCPQCGLTYGEFRRSGRLGCGTCYESFAAELKPLLRRIHGCTEHTGNVPDTLADGHARKRELKNLKAELERAVREEQYERAAELRDLIRAREEGGREAVVDGVGAAGDGTEVAADGTEAAADGAAVNEAEPGKTEATDGDA